MNTNKTIEALLLEWNCLASFESLPKINAEWKVCSKKNLNESTHLPNRQTLNLFHSLGTTRPQKAKRSNELMEKLVFFCERHVYLWITHTETTLERSSNVSSHVLMTCKRNYVHNLKQNSLWASVPLFICWRNIDTQNNLTTTMTWVLKSNENEKRNKAKKHMRFPFAKTKMLISIMQTSMQAHQKENLQGFQWIILSEDREWIIWMLWERMLNCWLPGETRDGRIIHNDTKSPLKHIKTKGVLYGFAFLGDIAHCEREWNKNHK